MNEQETYKFCPRCGKSMIVQRSHLHCISCHFSLYINPAPCNSVIIDKQQCILLVQRAKEPKKGTWDLPGGFIEAGETLEESIQREVLEELGVEVSLQQIVDTSIDTYEYQGITKATFGICVLAQITTGELHPHDDVASYMFFSYNEVLHQDIGFPAIRQVLQTYLQQKC
jgi:NADH pyrophosphatase NudC (nudix superfamily)